MMLPFFGADFLRMGHSPLLSRMQSEAQSDNLITMVEKFNYFSNLAITRINWHGLPDSVSERFLNMSLYFYGQAAFFFDPELGYMCLPCTVQEYNSYYEPTVVRAYSFKIERQLGPGEFVFIRNTPTCSPTAFAVWTYTKRMVSVLRTIDTTLFLMKKPYFLLCEEKQRQTFLNLFKKVGDNEVLILGSKNWGDDFNGLTKIDTGVNNDLEKLWESYDKIEHILLNVIGIQNADNEKQERLLVDEVNANNMLTDMSMESTLKELSEACARIKQIFGLDISATATMSSQYSTQKITAGGEEPNE